MLALLGNSPTRPNRWLAQARNWHSHLCSIWLAWGDHTLGTGRVDRGEPSAALEHFERGGATPTPPDGRDPAMRNLPNGIEALIALGRLEEAFAQIADYEQRCAPERHARVLALVARYSGLIAWLRGEHEKAEAEFARSLELQERAPSPYYRARTLMASAVGAASEPAAW